MARQQQQDLIVLGQAVRELRVERHRSIRNRAMLCGVSVRCLAAIEEGRLDPSFRLLDALAEGLAVERPEIALRAQQLAARDPGSPPGEQAR
jgi:transcriptional regulator with XRE-family HTH domain